MRNVLVRELAKKARGGGWTKAQLEAMARELRLGQPGTLGALLVVLTQTDRGEVELFSTLSESETPPLLDRKTLAKALRALATMYDP